MTTKSRRALLLVALTFSGIVVGAIGQEMTGNDAWFLAIPILLAVGWFAVADPEQCMHQSNGIPKPDAE